MEFIGTRIALIDAGFGDLGLDRDFCGNLGWDAENEGNSRFPRFAKDGKQERQGQRQRSNGNSNGNSRKV